MVATEYKVDISESTFVLGLTVPVQGNGCLAERSLSERELVEAEEYLKNGSHLSLPLSTVFPLMWTEERKALGYAFVSKTAWGRGEESQ